VIEALRSHIEAKIKGSEIMDFPFPHLIIENFFPEDIYRSLLEKNPFKNNIGVEWQSKAQTAQSKTGTPYYARKQINFHTGDPFQAAPEDASFWNDLKATFLRDNWFPKLIMEKYPAYFSIRFGELVNTPDFFGNFKKELFLQRHEPGYYIGPHTDVPTRIFTCIFSFAEKEGFEEFGTEFCVNKDPLARCWGNNHYKPDDFIVTKVAPYKPNNFLLFFKTRQSFHSVRSIDASVPNQRYGMQFQSYEPVGGIFRDLSEPDLLRVRHNKKQQGKLRQIVDILRS